MSKEKLTERKIPRGIDEQGKVTRKKNSASKEKLTKRRFERIESSRQKLEKLVAKADGGSTLVFDSWTRREGDGKQELKESIYGESHTFETLMMSKVQSKFGSAPQRR